MTGSIVEPSLELVLRLPEPDGRRALAEIETHGGMAPRVVQSAGALGGGDLMTIIVAVGAGSIPLIIKLIGQLDGNRKASIEYKNFKITGLSRSAAEEFLREKLMDGAGKDGK